MYNVTAKYDGQTETFTNKTLAQAKQIKKNLNGWTVTWSKSAVAETSKVWFYRGQQVEIVENRQNGWTLVNNTDGSRFFYLAVTRELEQR